MASSLLRSGYATLEYEIAQEKASALGRLGRRLEAALVALAACPRTATSDRKIRDSLVEQAGYALWLFVVQREACGLNDSAQVMQDYGVPNEVYARMGPLAMPNLTASLGRHPGGRKPPQDETSRAFRAYGKWV
jgi:Family of unknown function (DUF6665)